LSEQRVDGALQLADHRPDPTPLDQPLPRTNIPIVLLSGDPVGAGFVNGTSFCAQCLSRCGEICDDGGLAVPYNHRLR
jgi:hypothetical protein